MSTQLPSNTPRRTTTGAAPTHRRSLSTGDLTRGDDFESQSASMRPDGDAESDLRPRPRRRRSERPMPPLVADDDAAVLAPPPEPEPEGVPSWTPSITLDHHFLERPFACFTILVQSNVDWHASVSLELARYLRAMLALTQRHAILRGACEPFKVRALRDALANGPVLDATKQLDLLAYARALVRLTIPLTPASSVPEALELGAAVRRTETALQAQLSPERLAFVFETAPFVHMVRNDMLDDFIDDVAAGRVSLDTPNGRELESYIFQRQEGAPPLASLDPKLSDRMKNAHRQEAKLLRRLDADKTPDDRPVVLVIAAGADHNGVAHRNPEIGNLATSVPTSFRLVMVEGQPTLSFVRRAMCWFSEGQVEQVIIAGHAGARTMNLGPTMGDTVNLDLGSGDQESLRLVDLLLSRLAPHAQVALLACLTETYDFPHIQPGEDPEAYRAALVDHMAENRPLARLLADALAGKASTVIGGNGSVTPRAKLWDDAAGCVSLCDASDPALTGSKDDYAALGQEPKGVWSALLELWADTSKGPERARFQAAVARRCREKPGLGTAIGELLYMQCQLIESEMLLHDAHGLGQLRKLSEAMTHLWAPAGNSGLMRLVADLGFAAGKPFFAEHLAFARTWLVAHPISKLRLAALTCGDDGGTALLDVLAEVGLQAAKRDVDLHPVIDLVGDIVDGAYAPGRVVLAALVLFHGGLRTSAAAAPCGRFLLSLAEGVGFRSTLRIPSLLAGDSAEELFMRAREAAGTDAPPLPDNLRSHGALQADVRVAPRNLWARATEHAPLHERPDGPRVSRLAASTVVEIVGEVAGFAAILWGGETRFVPQRCLVLM